MKVVLERFFAPWRRRILLMIGRAVLYASDVSNGRQVIKIEALKGEFLDEVEHFQTYGFASRPPKGSEIIIGSVFGERARSVAFASSHKDYEPQDYKEGETIFYTWEDEGSGGKHRIHLKEGREIDLKCAELVIEAGAVTVIMNNDGVLFRTPRFEWEKT